MQHDQRRRGVEPQLVGQRLPVAPVDRQCVRDRPGGVEGPHQQLDAPLPQRMLREQAAEAGHGLAEPAGPEQRGRVVLAGPEPGLVEGARLGDRQVRQVHPGGAAPQVEGVARAR